MIYPEASTKNYLHRCMQNTLCRVCEISNILLAAMNSINYLLAGKPETWNVFSQKHCFQQIEADN